jgi:hypothetical protein
LRLKMEVLIGLFVVIYGKTKFPLEVPASAHTNALVSSS